MDDLDRTAIPEPLAPVGEGVSRRPIAAVLVAGLVVLALAIPKPWAPSRPVEAIPDGSSPAGGSAGRVGLAAPASTSSTYEPLRSICGSPGGWRAATVHRWPNRESPIRTWSAIEPGPATGPTDPDIPFVDVVAAVTALGYCSPRGPSGAPGDTTAEIWAVTGRKAVRIEAELSEPDAPHPLGGFWAPPPQARAEILRAEAWRPGRYAIRLRGTAFDRWIGIEIRAPPGPEPTPSLAPATPGTPSGEPSPSAS